MAGSAMSWIGEVARDVEEFVARRDKSASDPIVVASSISPSGPVHLGNLREVIVAHAVGEELLERPLGLTFHGLVDPRPRTIDLVKSVAS